MDNSKLKIVYVVTQRGTRRFWSRCGVAFVNRDGSLSVKLEAVPVSGEMVIRDYTPREDHALGEAAEHPASNGNGSALLTLSEMA
jgi:hypothetical protein